MQVLLWSFVSRMGVFMASTLSVMEVYRPGPRLFIVVGFENLSSKILNFPSVIFWYIDLYDFFWIAASCCTSKFTCSGEKVVKELTVLSGNILQKRQKLTLL